MNMTKLRISKACFLLMAGLVVSSTVNAQPIRLGAANPVYRYEDSGMTYYGDRAPSSDKDGGHVIMSKQGVVLQKVMGRSDRKKARKAEQDEALRRTQDRALLATFTTEQDLIRTRDDRLGMVDGLISRLDDRIRILSDRLHIVEKRIASQETSKGEGKAQDSMYKERKSLNRNIENAWSLVDTKAEERSEIATKFDNDLIRFRELKSSHTR